MIFAMYTIVSGSYVVVLNLFLVLEISDHSNMVCDEGNETGCDVIVTI